VPAPLAFRLDGVSLHYRTLPAVDGVDLRIDPGEAVALIGPSGAGKTTLLGLLGGALAPTHGRVLVDGVDLATLAPRRVRRFRSRIGFVHQDRALVPNLRVAQNVLAGRLGRLSFAGSLRALVRPRRADLLRVHTLLERVGVEEKLFERTDRLSGGEQQRVAVARALFQEPGALLADEPVASVDPARARDTVALLAHLSREEGLTLAVSLHDLGLARAYFGRLVGVRRGRVVFDGPPDALADEAFADLYRLDRAESLAHGA